MHLLTAPRPGVQAQAQRAALPEASLLGLQVTASSCLLTRSYLQVTPRASLFPKNPSQLAQGPPDGLSSPEHPLSRSQLQS